MSATIQKVGIRSVWLERAEGPIAECGEVTVNTIAEAQKVLRRWSHSAPEEGGGYDKCDFKVTFEDGETYTGRYDLQNTGLNDGGETLAGQMRSFIGFIAGNRRPAWCSDKDWADIRRDKESDGSAKDAREFLEKYDF